MYARTMKSTVGLAAAAASSLFFSSLLLSTGAAANTAQSGVPMETATVKQPMNTETYIGCFDDATPLLDHGSYIFQSKGNCQPICYQLEMPVMALTGGTNCWCGEYLPALKAQVANDTCATKCNGYDTEICGGDNLWTVYLTGITANKVANWDPDTNAPATTSYSRIASGTPSVVTVGGSTVVMTIGDEASAVASSKAKSAGPNKAGIAAGVVVGVVAIVGIVAGVWLFLRHKRRREIEEEHRRAAAVSEFVKNGSRDIHTSASSMNDSRLDPEVMGQRRMSDGSIADNQDYSRRILKVTNPS